ncbi:unnamed protein product [Clonostachys rosea f. rosea IK726]|uniref:Uncharacterized protein n=1 Tax=Clonostachys rosea f. rosea IK726 TaxID=1349383 RepID=A0ACA9TL25_BIOOC|nr:unnamed protein product [Clonostachys rosea f. rosea IK726]
MLRHTDQPVKEDRGENVEHNEGIANTEVPPPVGVACADLLEESVGAGHGAVLAHTSSSLVPKLTTSSLRVWPKPIAASQAIGSGHLHKLV